MTIAIKYDGDALNFEAVMGRTISFAYR
jgi:hypothetical protein